MSVRNLHGRSTTFFELESDIPQLHITFEYHIKLLYKNGLLAFPSAINSICMHDFPSYYIDGYGRKKPIISMH